MNQDWQACPRCRAPLGLSGDGTPRTHCPACGAQLVLAGAEWYWTRNRQRHGPYTLAQLHEMARCGGLHRDDMVWQRGTPRWVAAGSVAGLFSETTAATAATVQSMPAAEPVVVGVEPTRVWRLDPAGPALPEPEWYYARNQTKFGPLTWDQFRELACRGEVLGDDMVWRRGTQRWVKAESVAKLFGEEPPAIESAAGPAAPTVLETIKENTADAPLPPDVSVVMNGTPDSAGEPTRNGTHAALTLATAPAVAVIPGPTPVRLPIPAEVQTIHARPARPPVAMPSLSVPLLFQAFCRRWFLAACLGLLLGGGAAVSMWFLRPAKYTASATLQVAPLEPHLLPKDGVVYDATSENYQRTQVSLITSMPVLRAALRNDRVRSLPIIQQQESPTTWLTEHLRAQFVEGTELLRLSMTGEDPQVLALIVNGVKDAYLEEVVNAERKLKLVKLDQLDKACIAQEQKIRTLREQIRVLAEQLKTSDSQTLTARQRALLGQYDVAQQEYARIAGELAKSQAELDVQLRKKNGPTDQPGVVAVTGALVKAAFSRRGEVEVPSSLVEEALDTDPIVFKHFQDMNRSEYHPAYAKKLLDEVRAQQRPLVARRLQNKMQGDADSIISSLQKRIEVLQKQVEIKKTDAERLEKEVDKIGGASHDLVGNQRRLDEMESLLKTMRTEKERLQIEVASAAQRVRVWHAAEPPETKSLRLQIATTAMAGGLGCFLGLFLISLWEFRSQRINTSHEVTVDLDLRVVGTLPLLPDRRPVRRGGTPARNTYIHDLFTESIDGIRTILLREGAGEPIRSLMITSAIGGEGKTMLAGPLGASIARTGRRTLLIDCDLRHPSVHQLFDMPATPGLSDVLRGEISVADAIQIHEASGLAILPAGEFDRQVLRQLAQDSFRDLLASVRAEYDFVLLDAPPLLPVADALLIGQHADAAVMSVRPQISRKPQVQAACERLQAAKIRVIGTVVNGIREKVHSYDYTYLYGRTSPEPATTPS